MTLTAYVADFCHPDYLQDHHNRDNECLVGIYPNGQDVKQIAEDVIKELNGYVAHMVPGRYLDDDIRRAILDLYANKSEDCRLWPVDENGDDVKDPEKFDDLPDEQPSLWIVLKWPELTLRERVEEYQREFGWSDGTVLTEILVAVEECGSDSIKNTILDELEARADEDRRNSDPE